MQATPTAASAAAAFNKPLTNRLACRFLWKECRRIAGLSVGIAAIAVAVMLGFVCLAPATARLPAVMLIVAFGGAAMLAIAAAITLFSVEKEEGTADLLRTLPKNNVGLLLGKFAAAGLSVIALWAVLSLVAYAVAGGWPSGSDADLILPQGAIVLAEALAYGILASLICPYPLIAAVLGIVIASLNSQLAVLLLVPSGYGYEASALQAALPARWAFVAVVAVFDWWLGTRWLPTNPHSRRGARGRVLDLTAETPKLRRRWLTSFVRLVWQSARQSWGIALAVTLLGGCLSFAFVLVLEMLTTNAPSWRPIGPFSTLFVPALLGAMVFRADQRREQYRFLAEHAGRPRTVWLARLLTWSTPTLMVLGAVCFAAAWVGLAAVQSDAQHRWLWHNPRVGMISASDAMGTQVEVEYARLAVVRAALLYLLAAFTAFAYGQLFSISLKSEIFAALLSLVASIFIACWAFGLWFSGLSMFWFLFPLGAGAFLASWLRVSDWMLDRRGLTRWVLPLAALLLPIGLALVTAPAARLRQVPDLTSISTRSGALYYADIFSRAAQEQNQGREVASDYQRLASQLGRDDSGLVLSDDEHKELIGLTKVRCRLPATFLQQGQQSSVIQNLQFALLSRGQENRFDEGERQPSSEPPLAAENDPTSGLDQRIASILACRRLAVQQSNGLTLTNALYPGYLSNELLDWATADGQTAERIREAIAELQAIERSCLSPAGRLANESLRIRSIVRGEAPPSFLSRRASDRGAKPSLDEWLAFLANNLPGESERAQRSLAVLSISWTLYLQEIEDRLLPEESTSTEASATAWRQRLTRHHGPYPLLPLLAATEHLLPFGNDRLQRAEVYRQAQTSYLVTQEFADSWRLSQSVTEWVSTISWWRAERVRLAMIAYRLRSGSYPTTLEELTPDFIESSQYRDPFCNRPFGYAPEGFGHRTTDTWMYFSSNGTLAPTIPPGTPVLWSRGTGEAKPTVALARKEEGSEVEIVIEEGSADTETEGGEPVMVLQPTPGFGGSRHFWIPLPN